jgi:hypothetical protein
MEPLAIVDEGLQALHSWLELIWPYLLLPPLFRWAWVSVRGRLGSLWDRALEHPLGFLWPVPAALLPPLIAFAKDGDPLGTKGFTVAGLLLAIAVTQIYGQLRTQRYKELGDAEIRRISAGVNSIGFDLGRLAGYLEAEEEESGS